MIPLVSSVIELVGKVVFAFLFIPQFAYLAVIFCEPVIWCLMTVQLIYAFVTHPIYSLACAEIKNIVMKKRGQSDESVCF